jgi:multidrug efflux pump subunit AcrA (membrane-fusion protein)
MTKKQILITIGILAVVGLWIGKKYLASKEKDTKAKISMADASTYYTCPMHPFIHMDKAGKCPICHMDLVKVEAKSAEEQTAKSTTTQSRGSVVAPANLLSLVGVTKHKVEKMDLTLKLPVAGRFNSARGIAFQVYEQDLRLLKNGLKFKGTTPSRPNETLEGVIVSIDSIIDPTSRTSRVVGQLQSGNSLPAEATFEGAVEVPLKNKIAIPEEAVLHTGTQDLVYVFSTGNMLTAKVVKLGVHTLEYYEVVDGLQEGEEISSGPNFLIDSEARIRGTSQ